MPTTSHWHRLVSPLKSVSAVMASAATLRTRRGLSGRRDAPWTSPYFPPRDGIRVVAARVPTRAGRVANSGDCRDGDGGVHVQERFAASCARQEPARDATHRHLWFPPERMEQAALRSITLCWTDPAHLGVRGAWRERESLREGRILEGFEEGCRTSCLRSGGKLCGLPTFRTPFRCPGAGGGGDAPVHPYERLKLLMVLVGTDSPLPGPS